MIADTYIIDTFTSTRFRGNPTGVCYAKVAINDSLMQSIAIELNFPVTAFITPISQEGYAIRYFTPLTEIPACGHATLASAKVAALKNSHHHPVFHTPTGTIIQTEVSRNTIFMSYPEYEMQEYKVNKAVLNSLGLQEYKTAGYCNQLETLFIEIENPDQLRSLQPDYAALTGSSDIIREVVITSIADSKQYDYLLRSFCPWIGIDEDPVTGSVHSVLGGFWEKRLNKSHLKAYQASARGGELLIKTGGGKVEIVGQTVIVLTGQMNI